MTGLIASGASRNGSSKCCVHSFTHEEYADMVYVYGYCNGNANAAVDEYRRTYPLRRTPNRAVFTNVFCHYVSVGNFLVYMCHQNADQYKQLRNRKKL